MSSRSARRVSRVKLGGWVWVPLLAGLAVAGSSLGSTQVSEGQLATARPTTVPVEHRELVCPDASLKGKPRIHSEVRVLSADFDGAEVGGTVQVTRESSNRRSTSLVVQRGVPVALRKNPDVGYAIVADGPAAQGLQAVRIDSGKTVAGASECVSSAADWWFSGGGASITRTSTLMLRNVDAGDASIHLRVFSPNGEVVPSTSTDLVLSPGDSQKVDLSLLAPFNDNLTVWVHADRGRVAAAMIDRVRGKALRQDALGWMSGQSAPSRSVRLVANFPAARSATVLVTNPHDRDAIVSFEVAGKNGWFASPHLEDLTLGPGEAVSVPVTKALGHGAAALRVTADRPVVAAARLVGPTDLAHVESTATFSDPSFAMVPDAKKAVLTLLGGGEESTVDVVAYNRRGKTLASKSLTLAAGAVSAVRLPSGTTLVGVTPSAGSLSAAITLEDPGLAVLPLRGLVVSVAQPAIVPFTG